MSRNFDQESKAANEALPTAQDGYAIDENEQKYAEEAGEDGQVPSLAGEDGQDPSTLDGAGAPVTPTEPVMTKIQGSAHEGTGTSISSQIQKIIARELGAPSKKGRIDLQSVPMKEYLEHTVIPIIHQGLIAIARERPSSPIEYLAAFFLKHKRKYMTENDPQQMFNSDIDPEKEMLPPHDDTFNSEPPSASNE